MSQRPDLAPPPGSATTPNPSGAPFVRPRWATAIGILSILYASLGFFYHLHDLGVMLWLKLVPLKDLRPEDGRLWEGLPAWAWRCWAVMNGSFLVLAAALLAGGILLLRCRRAARPLHLLGASGMLVTVAVCLGVERMFSGNPFEDNVAALLTASLCAVRVAYPVFVLAWFLRKKNWNGADAWA
jgi:hypothetical protein